MQFGQMLKRYRIYRKLSLGVLITLALTIALLSLCLYVFFSDVLMCELGDMAQSNMLQVAYTLEDLQSRISALTLQLSSNADVITAMFRKGNDPVKVYYATTQMSFNRSIQPYVSWIAICNSITNRVYGTEIFSTEESGQLLELLKELYRTRKNIGYFSFIYKKAFLSESMVQSVCYYRISDLSVSENEMGAIVVAVNPQYLLDMICKAKTSLTGTVALVAEDGTVLAHSDSEKIFSNASSDALVQRVMEEIPDSGSLLLEVDGIAYMASYASIPGTHWRVSNFQVQSELQAMLRGVLTSVLLIALGLALVGITVSIFTTKRAYSPIARELTAGGGATADRMLDEAEYLRQHFYRWHELVSSQQLTAPVVREALLMNLITDKWGCTIDAHMWSSAGIRLDAPYFCVLIFSLDKPSGSASQMRSMLEQRLPMLFPSFDTVMLNETDLAVLARPERNAIPEELPLFMGELRSTGGPSLSCSVGTIVSQVDEIYDSYTTASGRLVYRFYVGYGALLQDDEAARGHNAYLPFPVQLEAQLRAAMTDGDVDAAGQRLAACFEHLRALTPDMAILFAHQLVIGMLRKVPAAQDNRDVQASCMRVMEQLNQCRLEEELISLVSGICLKLTGLQHEKRKAALNPLVEQMLAYINERYQDCSISLDSIADELNRSAPYLGRLFREETGQSFGEALNSRRMESGAQLLRETGLSVADICAAVGVSNVNYFYVQFKKKYGCTPQTWRNTGR